MQWNMPTTSSEWDPPKRSLFFCLFVFSKSWVREMPKKKRKLCETRFALMPLIGWEKFQIHFLSAAWCGRTTYYYLFSFMANSWVAWTVLCRSFQIQFLKQTLSNHLQKVTCTEIHLPSADRKIRCISPVVDFFLLRLWRAGLCFSRAFRVIAGLTDSRVARTRALIASLSPLAQLRKGNCHALCTRSCHLGLSCSLRGKELTVSQNHQKCPMYKCSIFRAAVRPPDKCSKMYLSGNKNQPSGKLTRLKWRCQDCCCVQLRIGAEMLFFLLTRMGTVEIFLTISPQPQNPPFIKLRLKWRISHKKRSLRGKHGCWGERSLSGEGAAKIYQHGGANVNHPHQAEFFLPKAGLCEWQDCVAGKWKGRRKTERWKEFKKNAKNNWIT